jgi:hypothetical protein
MRFRTTDLIMMVAITATFAYQAHVALTLRRHGFERWEIVLTLGVSGVTYLLASWAALAVLRRWRKSSKVTQAANPLPESVSGVAAPR